MHCFRTAATLLPLLPSIAYAFIASLAAPYAAAATRPPFPSVRRLRVLQPLRFFQPAIFYITLCIDAHPALSFL